MNDPHVVRLQYKLHTREHLSFKAPAPLDGETDAFRMRLADGALTFEMKEHHATEESARKRVEPWLRAWEIDTDLRDGRGSIRFKFDRSQIIDRNPPPPGSPRDVVAHVATIRLSLTAGAAKVHVTRASYPPIPTRFVASPDVETMLMRYQMYLDGKEPLLSMANACMTLLEGSTGATSNIRQAFCQTYTIARDVREKLGYIVSERGGPDEARKLGTSATKTPLTGKEKQWVKDVVKALIRRKAEYDADPAAPLPQITMADFVTL
jgi:hypothetical protein